ncbi:MAG TPA: serine kinase [Verrucomicrobiae bacterium]|jgi:hypothetical protein|nr:serine kinase [Verrucomicrobiae bacterium]
MGNSATDRSIASNARPLTPPEFFAAVLRSFKSADSAAANTIDRQYAIGGYTIRLRFAGPALIPVITPALEHLTCDDSPAALTVYLWDDASGSSGTPPPPPWSWDEYMASGKLSAYCDGRIRAAFQYGSLSMLDIERDLALYWAPDARRVPYYESGSPLLTIFHWWMSRHGRQLIHAGAVGTAGGGVLLAGKGGSGKSSTALACLDSGLFYASDDYCLVASEPMPYAHSIYSSGKVAAEDVGHFPFLSSALSNGDCLKSEKALYFLAAHFPQKLSRGFPIRAILFPRVTGSTETRLVKLSPAESLLALAPSTIFQLTGAGGRELSNLGRLVRSVPCYMLHLGPDRSAAARVIADLLA